MSTNVIPGPHSDKATGAPVVVDLGKRKKKQIKELREGKPGKLLREVYEAVEALKAQNAISADAQTVIVVVRQKPRQNGLFGL
jgi:hypothetical protein